MFNPTLWANIILVIHLLFVLGVVMPIPLIILGGLLHWQWIRNPWFRNIHLAMIGIVLFIVTLKIGCPLTVWEQKLRTLAGQTSYEGTFIGYWVSRLLYYHFPLWVFNVVYFCVGLLIAALYFIFPPRKK